MKTPEQYFHEHRSDFDAAEPSPGHLDRFAARLDSLHAETEQSHPARRSFLKIAAAILVLITVAAVTLEFATRGITGLVTEGSRTTELPEEVREAVQYYDDRVSMQLATLNTMTGDSKEAGALGREALREIGSLDASTEDLKRTLASNPGNERVLDAIIRNQQMKEAILNTMISRISSGNR